MLPGSEIIRSRSHPLVKRLRGLLDRAEKDRAFAVLEGPKLVEDALASGVGIVEVAVSPRLDRTSRGARLLHELRGRSTAVLLVDDDLLSRLSEMEQHQGVLAVARRPSSKESQLLAGTPLLIVGVAIQNPGNLGGLLRTAEAAGATGALLTAGCADPFSWKALRGAMGSALRLPQLTGLGLDEAFEWLRVHGVRTVATTPDAPVPYHEVDLRRPTALLLGNEGAGLDEAVTRRAEVVVRIPIKPAVESLNVGVAAGIVLFEAARQRR